MLFKPYYEFVRDWMIKSFKDNRARQIHEGRRPKGIGIEIARRAVTKLLLIDTAVQLEDLRVPPGNRLESLSGDRAGQYSIRINDQWRICFSWENGDAFDVEICDYH